MWPALIQSACLSALEGRPAGSMLAFCAWGVRGPNQRHVCGASGAQQGQAPSVRAPGPLPWGWFRPHDARIESFFIDLALRLRLGFRARAPAPARAVAAQQARSRLCWPRHAAAAACVYTGSRLARI